MRCLYKIPANFDQRWILMLQESVCMSLAFRNWNCNGTITGQVRKDKGRNKESVTVAYSSWKNNILKMDLIVGENQS